MYVGIYGSLLGFWIINKILCFVIGEDWQSRVFIWFCYFVFLSFPFFIYEIYVYRKQNENEAEKVHYINARNARIRAANRREDWGKFDFEDPNW